MSEQKIIPDEVCFDSRARHAINELCAQEVKKESYIRSLTDDFSVVDLVEHAMGGPKDA